MPYIIDEPLVNEDNQERKFKTIRRGLIGNIKNDWCLSLNGKINTRLQDT